MRQREREREREEFDCCGGVCGSSREKPPSKKVEREREKE
jgi:hypothetical protein